MFLSGKERLIFYMLCVTGIQSLSIRILIKVAKYIVVTIFQLDISIMCIFHYRTNSEDIVLEMLTYLETADYSIREEMVWNLTNERHCINCKFSMSYVMMFIILDRYWKLLFWQRNMQPITSGMWTSFLILSALQEIMYLRR